MGDDGTGGVFEADTFTLAFWETFYFQPGHYVFQYASDDGIRIILDGKRIVDEWRVQGFGRVKQTEPEWREGWHEVAIHYYENKGLAELYVNWYRMP